jgi:hypothetical protein
LQEHERQKNKTKPIDLKGRSRGDGNPVLQNEPKIEARRREPPDVENEKTKPILGFSC